MAPDDDKTRAVTVLSKGTIINHYLIIEKIGAGGMGEVYLAEDTELNRKVALKFLPLHLCQEADCRTRFKREAQAAAKLNHPNIVTIYEVSEFNGRPFFAMEHVAGQSLRELIKGKELPIERVIELAIQICEGLHKAHQSGIVHRDVKPANILIDADGRAKILDFGLATVQGCDHLTKTGSTLGTIGYMSPEQVRGEQVDHRTDIFSHGVVLYELIAGRQPFRGDNDTATSRNIIDQEPEPLARYKVDVPAELQRIVSKALAKDTDLRYQHADEMLADLRAILQMANPAARSKKPTTKLILVGGGMLIIAAVVFGYFQLLPKPASGILKSIAVLPFEDMSPLKDQEYFCDGMTEELIGRLSNIRDLRVPSRTSVFLFKGRTFDIREIGDKLKVQAVLEGSIRKSGNQLRITTQLINVADGYHLWSETYDRELKEVFAIQDEISSAIAGKLRLTLLGEERAKLTKRPTTDIEAYNSYLLGWYFLNKFTDDNFRKAIVHFEQAISRDSNFALAYVGKAICYNDLFLDMFTSRGDCYDQAKAAAAKAVELGEDIGEAHSALGRVKLFFEWDLSGAEKEFKRSIELSPESRECHNAYSMYLCIAGKFEEAIAGFKRASELDPADPSMSFMLGDWGYVIAGRYHDAIIQNQKTLQMDPHYYNSQLSLAYCSALNGQFTESVSLADSLIAADSTRANHPYLIWVYAVSGKEEKARHLLSRLLEIRAQRYVDAYMIAVIYAGLGDTNKAFEWLAKGYEERSSQMIFLKHDAMFGSLRSDHRFKELIRKIGMEP